MGEINFIVEKDFSLPKRINCNFEEVKQEITAAVEKYKNIVVTEDTITESKEIVAGLNKQAQLIDTQRKAVKKEFTKPLTEFENKCKELTAIITDAASGIKAGLDVFEEQRKEKKRTAIKSYFDNIFIANELIKPDFDKIMAENDNWLNKTYDFDKVKEDIDKLFNQKKTDYNATLSLKSPYEITLINAIKDGKGLAEVIAYNNELLALREQIKAKQIIPDQSEQEEEIEEKLQIDFRVWATPKQLSALKQFLNSNHIQYGKVED